MFVALARPRLVVARAVPAVLAAVLALAVRGAIAQVRDEIRVYTDEIVERGQLEGELHFNTLPRPRPRTAVDDAQAARGLVLTPEISYGLTPDIEIETGLFVPLIDTADDTRYQVSPELRAKWIPRRAGPDGGTFWGAILEWTRTPWRPADAASFVELRGVAGLRRGRWLLAANLMLDWPVRPREGTRSPELGTAVKAVRRMDDGWGLGVEYHGDHGVWRDLAPRSEQLHVLYLTMDLGQRLPLHLGVGHGLNRSSGGWTFKGSLELPFD